MLPDVTIVNWSCQYNLNDANSSPIISKTFNVEDLIYQDKWKQLNKIIKIALIALPIVGSFFLATSPYHIAYKAIIVVGSITLSIIAATSILDYIQRTCLVAAEKLINHKEKYEELEKDFNFFQREYFDLNKIMEFEFSFFGSKDFDKKYGEKATENKTIKNAIDHVKRTMRALADCLSEEPVKTKLTQHSKWAAISNVKDKMQIVWDAIPQILQKEYTQPVRIALRQFLTVDSYNEIAFSLLMQKKNKIDYPYSSKYSLLVLGLESPKFKAILTSENQSIDFATDEEFWCTWLSGKVQTLENPVKVFELAIEYEVIWLINECLDKIPSVYLNEQIAEVSKTLQGINYYDHKEVEKLRKIAQGITANNYKDQLNAFLEMALIDKDFRKNTHYKIYTDKLINCMMNNQIIKSVFITSNEKEFWCTWLSGKVQTLQNPITVFELAIKYQVDWLIDACIKAYTNSIAKSAFMTGNEKEFWHTWLSGRVQTLENPIRVFELAIEYQVIWLIDACIKAYPDSIKESLPLLLTVSNEVSSVYLNEEIAQMSKTLQGINHYDHKEVENLKKIAQGITPNNYKDQLNAFLKIALSDKDFQKKPQYKIYRKELIDCMMNNWIIKGVLTAGNGIATIHLTKQSKVNQSWMVPQLIIAAESTIFNAKQKKGTSKVIEIPETPENEIFFKILCESKDLKELTKDQLLKMHALAIKHQVTWLKIECEQLTKNSRLHK